MLQALSKPRRSDAKIIEDSLLDEAINSVLACPCKPSRAPVGGCPNLMQCRDWFGAPSEAQQFFRDVRSK